MDDIAGEPRGRKGDDSSRAPGLLSPSSPPPSGSGPTLSPPSAGAAAGAVLALPAASAASQGAAAGLVASPRCLAGEMDGGGGETLLVRRSTGKNKKRPLPAAPAERERGSGGGRDRFRTLWRDYHDLLQESEAKKKRLASKKRRSLALLAEVKFLRRKYQSFLKGGSQQSHYRLKKARYTPSPLGSNKATGLADHGAGTGVPSTSKDPNFDLNQHSVRNDCQGQQDHPEADNFDEVGVDEDMMTTDVKLSVCRETGNSPASEGKRTVPWQDRLALKA